MKNADMPAMPVQGFVTDASGALCGQWIQYVGLTKREQLAAMAMQGILANPDSESTVMDHDTAAKSAVASADALLAALEPKP